MRIAIASILTVVAAVSSNAAGQWFSPGDYSASGSDAGAVLPGGAPGAVFTIDFTVGGIDPAHTFPVALAIDFRTTPSLSYDSLKLSLSESAVVSLPAFSAGQSACFLYDPGNYFEPIPAGCTVAVMDADLKAALADGVLDGQLWVEGAALAGTEAWQLDAAVLAMAHTPEPATIVVLCLGGVALVVRRRRA